MSNTAPSLLRADAAATPAGGVYHGYDRLKMSQFSAGASKPFGKVLGGDFTLAGEVGVKYIHDLPDVSERRYVRSDLYGQGPVNGVCLPGASAAQCSNDGYASALSWGYRLRASSIYGNVFDGVDLKPSITFGHDVKGWSYDSLFIEGRRLAIVALQADVKKRFFVEASWTPIWGGRYNFAKGPGFLRPRRWRDLLKTGTSGSSLNPFPIASRTAWEGGGCRVRCSRCRQVCKRRTRGTGSSNSTPWASHAWRNNTP